VKDIITLGACPANENAVQVGVNDYKCRADNQSGKFLNLIRRVVGKEPPGAQLKIKWFTHELGEYCEVVCEYDCSNEEAINYAYKCELCAPMNWEDSIPIDGEMEDWGVAD
jgi:hypothetical protein